MARNRNANRQGNSFDVQTRKRVWEKGTIVLETDKDKKRKDRCGAWIEWDKYGLTSVNGTGWEIDHIKPVAKGGSDDISNLQPLQWQNNRKKGDDYPSKNYCIVSSK